jgi:diguanylate cyclase (GGDEF)-like protein
MMRRKGISALALTAAMSGTLLAASAAPAHPGSGHGDWSAAVLHSGDERGQGAGGNGIHSSPGHGGGGTGNSGQDGDSQGGSEGGAPTGASRGVGGSGSPASAIGSGGPGQSSVQLGTPSSQSQIGTGVARPTPGDSDGNGNVDGDGNGNGNSALCRDSCHVSQQPPVATSTFTPIPSPSATLATSASATPVTSASATPPAVTVTPLAPTPAAPAIASGPQPLSRIRADSSTSSARIGAARAPSRNAVAPGPVAVGLGGRASLGSGFRTPLTPSPTSSATLNSLVGPVPAASPATNSAGAARTSGQATPASAVTTPPPSSSPNVIQRIERVVPTGIWIALAAALAIAAAGGASALWSRRRIRRQEGVFAAMRDPLTGILNRRGFTEAFERELARARRYNRPFVLAYVDVRGLKAVNDTQGHRAGDELLREAAELLQASARADDVVGRLGGDEMGVLLVEQSSEGAEAVQRRIQSQVRARRAAMGLQTSWDLTIGTAAFPEDGDSFDELLRAADRRLYEQRGIELLEDPTADR